MENAAGTNHRVRFKAFELDLHTRELYRNGIRLRVLGQPIDVLEMLLERPGELVTREQLRKRLWPEDTFVDFEHSLNSAVTRLRDALGDRAEDPKFIETLPRMGYRFVATVQNDGDGPANAANRNSADAPLRAGAESVAAPCESETLSEKPMRRKRAVLRLIFLIASAAGLVGLAVLELRYLRKPLSPPRITFHQLTNDGRQKSLAGAQGGMLYVNTASETGPLITISNGASAEFRIDVPTKEQCMWVAPVIRDVSPDGSSLLVLCKKESYGPTDINGVWVVGALGHPARFLTDAHDAAWSADGASVVYSTVQGAIYRIGGGGRENRLIVPPMVQPPIRILVSDLTCSPDGNSIRFTRDSRIWEVSANGGETHPVLSPESWHARSCCGRWTAKGDYFLFLSDDAPRKRMMFGNGGGGQIWAIDERLHSQWRTPNANPMQLTSGPIGWTSIVPSRDGGKIFATGMVLRGELVRYDRQSKQLQQFLNGISVESVAFSQDGKHVAYVTFPEGILWRANRDGSGVTQLTAPNMGPSIPRWSPDGTQILFNSYDAAASPRSDVHVISSEGGEAKRFLPQSISGINGDADWSPDGQKVVFYAGPSPAAVKVFIYDISSHRICEVPQSEGLFSTRWSPDGRYIAALTVVEHDLSLFDMKLQKWSRLSRGHDENYPSWSRDSRFVYSWNEIGIHRYSVAGARSELVLDTRNIRQTGWAGVWFGLDPTDAPLLLRDAGGVEVYALDLEDR